MKHRPKLHLEQHISPASASRDKPGFLCGAHSSGPCRQPKEKALGLRAVTHMSEQTSAMDTMRDMSDPGFLSLQLLFPAPRCCLSGSVGPPSLTW